MTRPRAGALPSHLASLNPEDPDFPAVPTSVRLAPLILLLGYEPSPGSESVRACSSPVLLYPP